MAPPQYLSKKKKTERLSFTITPHLKKELSDFFEEQKEKNQENPEYKSISSFCYHAIKDILDIKKKGLSLDSIRSSPDAETENFYDRITFRALIDNFELGIMANKYNDENIKIPNFLYLFKRFILATTDPGDSQGIQNVIQKVRNFLVSNKLTKDLRIDLFHKVQNKYNEGVLEFVGNYLNLHFENCKAMAALLGILGIKVEDFTFSEKDIYARFDVVETELFYKKESLKKQRSVLLEENLKYIINYQKIINDDPMYFWMKISSSNDVFLDFMTPMAFEKVFQKIIQQFEEFGEKDTFLLNILMFFQNIHWIMIEDKEHLSFRFKLLSEQSPILSELRKQLREKYNKDSELNELMNLLIEEKSQKHVLFFNSIKQYANIKRENDIYYLEKK
ncbi:MAG: hypothetical protein JW891_08505 [Candidatus Lokiarchaeota archaeon]|nr:hypothetical protein [Candidatus Lokiarchaeota archaeon]